MSFLVSLFESVRPVAHCDAPEESKKEDEEVKSQSEEKEEGEKEEEHAEEEEEEPEDIMPVLREECEKSAKCVQLTKHFHHCQEKVEAGEGYKGEDCVEEIMMHCVDACVAPKLFSKLR